MTNNQRDVKIRDDIEVRADGAFYFTPLCLRGEDDEVKKLYFVSIYAEINPQGFLEEEWVQDIVDSTWKARGLRNLRVALLKASAYRGLEKILTSLIGPTDAMMLANDWHVRDKAAIKQVNEILASANISMDAVMAETLALRLPEIERIDRMITDASAGRAATFREIERYRSALAQQLRRKVEKIEDADYREIEDRSSGEEAA